MPESDYKTQLVPVNVDPKILLALRDEIDAALHAARNEEAARNNAEAGSSVDMLLKTTAVTLTMMPETARRLEAFAGMDSNCVIRYGELHCGP